MRIKTLKSRTHTCNHLRLFFNYLHVMGQKTTKLQRSLLPQSHRITSTAVVSWEMSMSGCFSPKIIPSCLLFQAVLSTSQHHQRPLHKAAATDLLSPILCITPRCLPYVLPLPWIKLAHAGNRRQRGWEKKNNKTNPDAVLFEATQFPQTSFY